MPAALANSLTAVEDRKGDHTTLVQVKENEVVATLTATIGTNIRQGDLETGVGSLSGEEASSEWEEKRQKSRMEGPRRRLLMWRSSPESMRDDLENINMLLFRFLGNGFRLALCNMSWLATQESVVLVPGRFGFAPWFALFDRGEPCGQLSRHATRCGVVFLLSHDPSQVQRKGDLGDGVAALRGQCLLRLRTQSRRFGASKH